MSGCRCFSLLLMLLVSTGAGRLSAGWVRTEMRETSEGADLRGFGRCAVTYETWKDAEMSVAAMRFACASDEKAETVVGKFLWDRSWNEPLQAFAVARCGTVATIYAAETQAELDAFFAGVPARKAEVVSKARCPEWMKRFDWGFYGVGGLENLHDWMRQAGAKRGERLDPREDFAFMREMGPMHFDNWLDLEGLDNSDGITNANGLQWKAKYAEELGIPYSYRLYMPCNGFAWINRRFADCMEKPAEWMMNGWHRYTVHQPHLSWYRQDVWGYIARRTYDEMEKFKTDRVRGWMHPAGELVHQPWYDMHGDYSPSARADWIAWLKKNGVTLEEVSAMYSRVDSGFACWDQVEVPEFATFAGLPGQIQDLAGTWFTSTNQTDWTAFRMPGNWDFEKRLYAGCNPRRARRLFRRDFSYDPASAGGKRVYFYFFPMSPVNSRHEVMLNGHSLGFVGTWCALDVTDGLKTGANKLVIDLEGYFWNGRVFLSTQPPAVYPNLGEARNRMFALWNDWRRDVKRRRCEEVFSAMRQADPNAPIKFMAPQRFGMPITDRLMHDWGAHAHFTGEGVWFYPWYKRYGKLWGYQGSSELAGPHNDIASMNNGLLRVFLAGLDMHEPVFLAQTYSRNPALREWWLKRKNLLQRMGKYDIFGPQVLIYRRSMLGEDDFPAPEPLVGAKGHRVNVPWDWDIGRGTLQSLGQSPLYIDDDGIDAGKMFAHKLIVDCGNEVIPPEMIEKIAAWVKAGGTFIAWPFSGRSTVTEGDSWPIARLTGARVTRLRPLGGRVTWKGVVYADNGRCVSCVGNNLNEYSLELEAAVPETEVAARYENGQAALTVRRLGKGRVVWLGSAFGRDAADIQGIWWPGEREREFWRTLLADIGFDEPLCETSDPLVWAQPYRSNDGNDFVTCLCNFNTNGMQNVAVTLRTDRRPLRLTAYGADGVSHPAFDYVDGVCRFSLPVEAQGVKVVNAGGAYAADEAIGYWWKENQITWHELKKPIGDFAQYEEGRWKDPTQDLKTGWMFEDGKPCVADVLQFWGLPDGAGATIRKTFAVENADWFKGGIIRFVCGAWNGPNFLSRGRIVLNGVELTDGPKEIRYFEKDVTRLLKPTGNELVLALDPPKVGMKFTGLNGSIYLYHRKFADRSFPLASLPTIFRVPADWEGRYRVFLYMEGDGIQPPLGVKVADRPMTKHHHNFGTVTDVDITSVLKFGEDNTLKPIGRAAHGGWDWSKIKMRIDLFETEKEMKQ